MGTFLITVLLGATVVRSVLHGPSMTPEDEIIRTIQTHASGGAVQDTDQIATVLSPDFRVIINRFRGAAGTSTLSREAYLTMIREHKAGGTPYTLSFEHVAVHKHTAEAEVWYRGEKSDMHHFFLLVQNEYNKWLIISDMAVVEPK